MDLTKNSANIHIPSLQILFDIFFFDTVTPLYMDTTKFEQL